MKNEVNLWYFADPMCSWCWGFSPVFEEIKENYGSKVKIALILGGLRPGTNEPVTKESRDEILHHWRAVNKMTGQEFNFANPMPDGFVYDTELPSRAVVAVSEINPEFTLPYFKKVQHAFYVEQKDVTDVHILAEIADHFQINTQDFIERYNSDIVKEKTLLHFQHTRQVEVRGFPTLVVSSEGTFKMLANGYRPYEDICQDLDNYLLDIHQEKTNE